MLWLSGQAAAKAVNFDAANLARETLRAGTPGIPLAKALTVRVKSADSSAARFVHRGATSQDVADTALILLLKRAQPILTADLYRLEAALRARISWRQLGRDRPLLSFLGANRSRCRHRWSG